MGVGRSCTLRGVVVLAGRWGERREGCGFLQLLVELGSEGAEFLEDGVQFAILRICPPDNNNNNNNNNNIN